MIITRKDDRRVLTVNEAFLHLTGRTDPEEVTGLSLTATGLQEPVDDLSRIESVLDQNRIFEGKESGIRTPGGTNPIFLSARSFTAAGEKAVTWSLVPIPVKTTERELPDPETVSENTKNFCYGFKTDFHLLESILKMRGLQAKQEAKDMHRQDRSFLYAVSSFYQMVTGTSGTDNVPICAYLNEVKVNIIEEYADLLQLITISAHCDEDWNIGNTITIPVGIIATELFLNSATHAFSPGETGRIELSFTREEEWYILQVMDSGRGFPDEITHGQPSGAGLAMVENLAMQLSGTASFSNDGGARIRIIFPDPDSG